MKSALLAAALALAPAPAAALDVNTASRAELEALPGLGVALTERVLEARARGPFGDWGDLLRRVKGLRETSAARLSAAGLTVGDAPYPAGSAAPTPASAPRR